MHHGHKFDPGHLARLDDPARVALLDPDLLWQEFGVERPARVAEVGAGTGLLAFRYARLLADGGTLWACDVAEEMVSWMHDHLPPELGGRVVPLRVEESRIDLPDAGLDMVYLVTVYHELESPERNLRDFLRLLRPGGVLAVADWRKALMAHGPPLGHRVDAAEIRRAIGAAGFADIRSSERHRSLSITVARRPVAQDGASA